MSNVVDCELVNGVITGEYIGNDGCHVAGAYITKDDGMIICSTLCFETLLARAGVPILMTLEEAEEKYGSEIIKRHEERKVQEQKLKEEKSRMARRESINRSLAQKHERTRAEIFREILRGTSKTDVTAKLGYSQTTVNKAIKEITKNNAKDVFSKYRDTIFADVTYEDLATYVEKADCNYREYRIILKQAIQEEVAEKAKETAKRAKYEAELDKQVSEYRAKLEAKAIAMGYDYLFKPSEPIECGYEKKLDKDGDEIATIEAIEELFASNRDSFNSVRNPMVGTVPTKKNPTDISEDSAPYVEKIMELQRKANQQKRLEEARRAYYHMPEDIYSSNEWEE